MIKIGLTGNIASGKSTVEAIIAQRGFSVVDLDKISHDLLNGECKNEVLKFFNTTDRKKLADIVFKDKKQLKKLENIIHPELKKYTLDYFKKNKKEQAAFVSGALIYEAGFDNLFDKIIYVNADKNIRLKRLMERNSLDKVSALLRIEAQREDFKNKANFIIENDGTLEDLKKQTFAILNEILS